MSDLYYIGVDPADGEGMAALAVCKLRPDGVREIVTVTSDPAEIASLMADTDFRS